MKHPALRCSDFPPDLLEIQRSFGLLRPFILILPVNDSETAGTIFHAIASLEFIVKLGRNIHIASLTNRILYGNNGHQVSLFFFHLVKYFQQPGI